MSGTPTPDVTWTKDGEDINDNRIDELESMNNLFRLEIDDLQEGDAGVYQCSISNPAGSDFGEIRIEVEVMVPNTGKYTDYITINEIGHFNPFLSCTSCT